MLMEPNPNQKCPYFAVKARALACPERCMHHHQVRSVSAVTCMLSQPACSAPASLLEASLCLKLPFQRKQ
eukprot:1136797-Pelagomonas_calceolata.AAC.6